MKSHLSLFVLLAALACNSESRNDRAEPELKDPQIVQPAADAIPDSMKIVNDSTIVPESTPAGGKVISPEQKPIEQ
ncbi:hypothetical protein [Flaviaesturariibacter amylovorans]|uniref:Cytochrome C n=1 Tax=Flaviaesturariibacter amylovorans TaxID=1084520 RepID=A0ABP8H616_9BACT